MAITRREPRDKAAAVIQAAGTVRAMRRHSCRRVISATQTHRLLGGTETKSLTTRDASWQLDPVNITAEVTNA